MESPFDRPPINVSAILLGADVPSWRTDYLATVSAKTDEKGRLLESLRTGEDPTIRDGVNLALSRLLDPDAPKDSRGKSAFLVHDGTGTGKSFQAILAAQAIAVETGEPALVTTRADLIPALRRDLDRLGLDDSRIALVAIEQLGAFLKDAQQQSQRFSVTVVDEAQDCRIPEVRRFLDRSPSNRQLFFSATPFHNIEEFCYFSSKLTGQPIYQVKNEISSAKDLHLAVADQLKRITLAGGMVHREFPFYGTVPPAELLPLSAESRTTETQLTDGYARLVKNSDFTRQRKLKEDLITELNTASDATKIDSILQRTLELLAQNRKVILVGDDLAVASRILKESDGLPKETPGFLSGIRAAMAAHGIECSFIQALPRNSEAIPALSRERAAVGARNDEEMTRFVDGAYRTNDNGQRVELRGRDSRPIYAPSQTKVILVPYQQAAGWPELNQRFPEAPEVSLILAPTASADQFMQAIGRGSRRNSQGPTEVRLVANHSLADRRRLSELLTGLRFIAATGSPAIAPFLQLAADCLDTASTQRAAEDQRLIQLQKNQQARSARILDFSRYRISSPQPGIRP